MRHRKNRESLERMFVRFAEKCLAVEATPKASIADSDRSIAASLGISV